MYMSFLFRSGNCTCTNSKLVWNCEMMYWSLIIKVYESPTHVVEPIFSWSLKSLLTSHLQYFCEFYNGPPQLTSWTSWSKHFEHKHDYVLAIILLPSYAFLEKNRAFLDPELHGQNVSHVCNLPIFTWLLFHKTFQNLLSVHNGVFQQKSTEMHGRDFLNRVQLN